MPSKAIGCHFLKVRDVQIPLKLVQSYAVTSKVKREGLFPAQANMVDQCGGHGDRSWDNLGVLGISWGWRVMVLLNAIITYK